MIRLAIICMLCVSLQGCAFLGWKGIEALTVKKQEVARTPLNLPDPAPIRSHSPRWIVVTPNNIEQVWQQLKESKTDLVLFALTDDGYEELAVNMAEIRNFIELQKKVLEEYRKYYESPKPAPAK